MPFVGDRAAVARYGIRDQGSTEPGRSRFGRDGRAASFLPPERELAVFDRPFHRHYAVFGAESASLGGVGRQFVKDERYSVRRMLPDLYRGTLKRGGGMCIGFSTAAMIFERSIRRNTSGFAAGIRCMDRYPKKYRCALSCSLPKISSSSKNGAVLRIFGARTSCRPTSRAMAERTIAQSFFTFLPSFSPASAPWARRYLRASNRSRPCSPCSPPSEGGWRGRCGCRSPHRATGCAGRIRRRKA
jgi:hypothetical protein